MIVFPGFVFVRCVTTHRFTDSILHLSISLVSFSLAFACLGRVFGCMSDIRHILLLSTTGNCCLLFRFCVRGLDHPNDIMAKEISKRTRSIGQ